jgi:hypothetical protein
MLGQAVLGIWRDVCTSRTDLAAVHAEVGLPRRTDLTERHEQLKRERDRLCASLRYSSLDHRTFLPLYLRQLSSPSSPADGAGIYLHDRRDGRDDLDQLDRANRRHVQRYLANLSVMERLTKVVDDLGTVEFHQELNRTAGMAPLQANLVALRIGTCVLVSSPCELLAQVGLDIKRMSPFPRTFVAAYTNGYAYYGVPAADFGLGGYESTECPLDSTWESVHQHTVADMLHRLSERATRVA